MVVNGYLNNETDIFFPPSQELNKWTYTGAQWRFGLDVVPKRAEFFVHPLEVAVDPLNTGIKICSLNNKSLEDLLTLNKLGRGGVAFGAPPVVFFCPSSLIFDTIPVKFFDF